MCICLIFAVNCMVYKHQCLVSNITFKRSQIFKCLCPDFVMLSYYWKVLFFSVKTGLFHIFLVYRLKSETRIAPNDISRNWNSMLCVVKKRLQFFYKALTTMLSSYCSLPSYHYFLYYVFCPQFKSMYDYFLVNTWSLLNIYSSLANIGYVFEYICRSNFC